MHGEILLKAMISRDPQPNQKSAPGSSWQDGFVFKIRGGIKIGGKYASWPGAQLCFTPEVMLLRFGGVYTFPKQEIEMISFLRGSITTEIRITHKCDFADSPFRFFPLFSRDAYSYVSLNGYACESIKAPFYTKGDITTGIDF